MPARLNRRRYRESVAALKEIISNPKAPAQRRLRAIETLLGIYDRHDETERRKVSRKATTEQPVPDAPEAPEPVRTQADILREAEEFLERHRQETTTNATE